MPHIFKGATVDVGKIEVDVRFHDGQWIARNIEITLPQEGFCGARLVVGSAAATSSPTVRGCVSRAIAFAEKTIDEVLRAGEPAPVVDDEDEPETAEDHEPLDLGTASYRELQVEAKRLGLDAGKRAAELRDMIAERYERDGAEVDTYVG